MLAIMELHNVQTGKHNRGAVAVEFTRLELVVLRDALSKQIGYLERAKKRVQDNPNNEGQAKYALKVRYIEADLEAALKLQKVITILKT